MIKRSDIVFYVGLVVLAVGSWAVAYSHHRVCRDIQGLAQETREFRIGQESYWQGRLNEKILQDDLRLRKLYSNLETATKTSP